MTKRGQLPTLKNTSTKKGFTLIELLVVISIIGLLSAVVLVSLQNARLKGKDAAIQELAHQMQNLFAIQYSKTTSYSALEAGTASNLGISCNTDSTTHVTVCVFTAASGCSAPSGFFASGSDEERTCLDIFNKSPVYDIGTADGFSNTYAIFIPYPSDSSKGTCVGSYAKPTNQTTAGNCFTSGVGW